MSLPRYPQFSTNNGRSTLSQQPSPTQSQSQIKTGRKSTNSSNIPVPASKGYSTSRGNNSPYRNKNEFSESEDFGDETNLSREESIVLLQPRMQPQGQENLSGNVTPTNPISDPQGEIFWSDII
jgi:hypothetical protein